MLMSKWNGERRKEQTCPLRVGCNALMTARPILSTLPLMYFAHRIYVSYYLNNGGIKLSPSMSERKLWLWKLWISFSVLLCARGMLIRLLFGGLPVFCKTSCGMLIFWLSARLREIKIGSHNSDVGQLVGNWNLNYHHLLLQMTVNVRTSSHIVH